MDDVVIRRPTKADVEELIANMRQADIDEVHATGGTVRGSVEEGVAISTLCYAAVLKGELACIFGVAPLGGSLLADEGVPWLLGTPVMTKRARSVIRLARGYIEQMLQTHGKLLNFVDARNTKAIGWLKRMGFQLSDDPVPYGRNKEPFFKFTMSPDHV